jgi:hypothetical protein
MDLLVKDWQRGFFKEDGKEEFEKRLIDIFNKLERYFSKFCPECQEWRGDDERVDVGMKCSFCAYGY